MTLSFPFWAPDWIIPQVQKWQRRKPRQQYLDGLCGDRDIEWSWIAEQLPPGAGRALDFGCGTSSLSLLAARRGLTVEAVDLQAIVFPFRHPRLRLLQGDLLELELTDGCYDVVINCSSVEHVGLAGRYGVRRSDPEGDLKAMQRLRRLLSARGVMLMTIPIGRDAVWSPWCRVYGEQRLPQLLDGFAIESEEYWHKETGRGWVTTDRAKALAARSSVESWQPHRNSYDLGCFVLSKSSANRGCD